MFFERGISSQGRLALEWTCLSCGWRQAYSRHQFKRTFGLTVEGPDLQAVPPRE